MDQLLSLLSQTGPQARILEQLTQPLLTLLAQVTGMESTYLTTIDLERLVQHVEFARKIGDMAIPEGLEVPWEDMQARTRREAPPHRRRRRMLG